MTTTQGQKFFGLFPDWRLKNAVKNASDEELEDSAEACEWWGWRGAMILMFGLIAEVILAFWDAPHESIPGRWGSAFGTVLVALGVGLEVQFARMGARRQGELTRRVKVRLGDAIERATKAEFATQDLKAKNLDFEAAVSPRILEQAITARALSPFADMSFLVVSPSDFEPKRTAGQIRWMLNEAKWRQFSGSLPPNRLSSFLDGVVVHGASGSERRQRAAAEALVEVLNENGIEARSGYPVIELGPTALLIKVGPKPLPKMLQLNPESMPRTPEGGASWGNVWEA